ncbi:MAG: hypothetical protein KA801_14515 [Syntrophorhabdaceae bacterium]|nr:hypothetical protein [Syntrophorhabdaceae bacterium]
MVGWIRGHEAIFAWLTAASIVVFVASLILVPFFIVRIPSDYFARGKGHRKLWADQHPVVRGVLMVAKNLLGCIFIVAGIFMLVLPGQGLLTILIGIMFLNFRGKYELERWIVSRRPVLRSINWIRRHAGRAPLVLEG